MTRTDRVAIVTGASRGIGKRIAITLAQGGIRLVVAARTIDPGGRAPGSIGETVADIVAAGGQAVAVRADMSSATDLAALVATAVEHFGGLDILVNNAAHTDSGGSPIGSYPLQSWLDQYTINVHAPFQLMRHVVPHMKARGGGTIINLTSMAADLDPEPLDAAARQPGLGPLIGYASSKAALNRLGNALAAELQPAGIAIIGIDPGFTRTERVEKLAARGLIDAGRAHDMDVPARLIRDLVDADDRMRHSGRIVRAGNPPLCGDDP